MIEITSLASGSSGNCYRVTDGNTPLLLECGIPFKQIKQGLDFQTSELAGCLVSHCHMDHCKAVKDVMKAGIDCYASKGTFDALGISGHRAAAVWPRGLFEIGTWIVLPFQTEHDAAEPLGFLLYSRETREKLLFATDTFYVRYRFRCLTHLMIECNYALDILQDNVSAGRIAPDRKNRLLKSHFSLANVKEFLMANDLSRVREIHLIHLSNDNSDAARFKREIQELTGKMVYCE